jgi:hypothetical protein
MKKTPSSKKTPRTRKPAARKPKSPLKGAEGFDVRNHPAYKRGVKTGKAELARRWARAKEVYARRCSSTIRADSNTSTPTPWYGFIFKIRDVVDRFLNGTN